MDVTVGNARVHPNIESKKSVTWIERVFVVYHAGHKVGVDGKLSFVEPAAGPWQELPQSFEWADYIVTMLGGNRNLKFQALKFQFHEIS